MNKNLIALAIGSVLTSGMANAADVKLSGYGSIRAGVLTSDNALANESFVQGIWNNTNDVDFKNESIFALQASTQLNNKWSATLVMQARGHNDFDLEARWAYVNYKVTPATTLTLGRFALPFFKSSDTMDIGYSHNYSRLPKAVYTAFDFAAIEGVRVNHSLALGEGDMTLKASYGNWEGDLKHAAFGTIPSSMKNIMQVSAEYNWEWLTLFAGGFQGDWSSDLDGYLNDSLLNAFDSYGLGDNYNITNGVMNTPNGDYNMGAMYAQDDTAFYYSAGVSIEYENYLFSSEVAQYGVDDSVSAGNKAFYVSAGYRMDDIVFSLVHQKAERGDLDDQANGSHDATLTSVIDGGVNQVASVGEFNSTGLHIRYDAMPGVAYKAEYSYIHGEALNEDIGLVTLGVDFVF